MLWSNVTCCLEGGKQMQQINGKIAFGGIAIGKIKEVFKENNVVRRVKINDVQAEIELSLIHI